MWSPIRQLMADVSDYRRRIVETQALIEQLNARAGIEARNCFADRSTVPPKRKAKRRRRKPVAARKRTPAAPVPVAVPASGNQSKGANAPSKAVRGAAAYGAELKAIDDIVGRARRG